MDPPPPDEITRARGADDEITRARGADDENHPSIRRPTDGRGGDATRARDTTARAGTTTRDARCAVARRRANARETRTGATRFDRTKRKDGANARESTATRRRRWRWRRRARSGTMIARR
jgi:hypothetical protein